MTTIVLGTDDGLRLPGVAAPVGLAGRRVTSLSADASWAVLDRSEIVRAAGGGWQPEGRVPDALCIAGVNGHALVGVAGAHLARVAPGSGPDTVSGFDEADGRDAWYTPWGGPPDVRSLAADGDAVYVNVHVGGIVRSGDGGATWEPTIEVDDDVHQVIAPDPGRLLAATGAAGLASSDDGGRTWRHAVDGLHGTYLRAVALAGDTIVVTASTGPFTKQGAVYRRALHGAGPFERCTEGIPERFADNIDTYRLAAAGSTVAVAAPDGRVYRSDDEGRSWSLVDEAGPGVHCVAVVRSSTTT